MSKTRLLVIAIPVLLSLTAFMMESQELLQQLFSMPRGDSVQHQVVFVEAMTSVVSNSTSSTLSSSSGPAVGATVKPVHVQHDAEKRSKVPRILYFIHKENILESKKPPEIYNNIMNTIYIYQQAWGERGVDVRFLIDDDCLRLLRKYAPDLEPYYVKETEGKYQSDICRVLALYETGGYYHDNDMVTEQARIMENVPNCTFSTARMAELPAHAPQRFFQSFLAATRWHPIFKQYLEKTQLEHYEMYYNATRMNNWDTTKRKDFHAGMGTKALATAYYEINFDSLESVSECLLDEKRYTAVRNNTLSKPTSPRRGNYGCEYAVFDSNELTRFFWSRIVGWGPWANFSCLLHQKQ